MYSSKYYVPSPLHCAQESVSFLTMGSTKRTLEPFNRFLKLL